MTNPIKEKIIKEFPDYFDRAVSECLAPDDKNTHVESLNHFLSSAFDRYAREVIKKILQEERKEPKVGSFHISGYNFCLFEIKRRADELLGKEEIVIVTAPCCKHIGVTSTCCCHCHLSSPNTYTAK